MSWFHEMFIDDVKPLLNRYACSCDGGGGDGESSNATVIYPKDVNFRDYDGTVLYSYTVEEAAALTELPPLPTRTGLICQGWNWSLADIQSHARAVEVGAMYITDDGKTRIYITLTEGRTSPMLGCCPNGTVTVDWGDGTTPDTLTGTSVSIVRWTPNHQYAAPGDYVIKLTVDGTMGFYGADSSAEMTGILRHSSDADSINQVYQNSVKAVEIGANISSIASYGFYYCVGLSSITIPNGITSIANDAFGGCSNLSAIIIPDSIITISSWALYYCLCLSCVSIPSSVTSIEEAAFRECNISSITIPDSVTTISTRVFYSCKRLTSMVIHGSVASIETHAFYNCTGLRYYDFTNHTAVPTLASANAFTGIAADCEIRVPAALYDEWIAATIWATYADYIVGV